MRVFRVSAALGCRVLGLGVLTVFVGPSLVPCSQKQNV